MTLSDWTDERVAALRRMWAAGDSAGVIAKKIGGTSRNAVIGKVHRLGLADRYTIAAEQCGRPSHKRVTRTQLPNRGGWPAPKQKTRPAAPHRIKPMGPGALPSTPPPAPAPTDAVRVQHNGLEPHHCRFIPFEPRDGFCGLPHVPGTPYCAHHLDRCTRETVTVEQRRRLVIAADTTAAAAAQEFLVPA